MNYLIAIAFCFNFIYCSLTFETDFGPCSLTNYGTTFTESDIKSIIQKKISKLNNEFNPTSSKKSFPFIVDDGQEKIYSSHWPWALGITYHKPEKIIVKDPAIAHISKMKFEMIVEHELNHLMVNRVKLQHTIPRWFKEGFAMYYSNEISFNHKVKVGQKIYNKKLFNLNDLKQFDAKNQQDFNFLYAQSAIYILTLQELYGNNILKRIFYNLQQGMSFNESFLNATSKSVNNFNQIAYKHIQSKYWWFKLISLPNQIFTFLPLLLVIGFILQSVHNKKIRQQWEIEEKLKEELEKE